MKREGHIIEEICDWSNLQESFDTVVRGTLRKKIREGRWLIAHRQQFLDAVRRELESGVVHLGTYHSKHIVEGGKHRDIQVYCMHDRIKVNAVMTIVDKHLRKRYIRTSAASIKERGMHDLMQYIRRDMATDPTLKYWYKFDVRKFYDTVRQDFVMYCYKRVFKDKRLLAILETFVRSVPGGIGMSMGLRASQGSCNLLLSVFLDHYLKDRYGVKHYYRYCDDGLIGSSNKLDLWWCHDIVHHQIESIEQEVKKNERIFPKESGLDFLGYVMFPTHTRLRKRVKQTYARKLKRIKSRKRRQQVLGSLYGMTKHANCRNLFKKLTGITMEEYVRMKDIGLKPKYNDGKKRFGGGEVNLADLVGEEFVVMDFESGIVTRPQRKEYEEKVARQQREFDAFASQGVQPPQGFVYPDQVPKPMGKYLLSIKRNPGRPNESEVKVWTGDKDNWSLLDQMRNQDLLGKIICTVNAVRCKGFTRYVLS